MCKFADSEEGANWYTPGFSGAKKNEKESEGQLTKRKKVGAETFRTSTTNSKLNPEGKE